TGAPVRYTWTLRIDPQVAQVYGHAAWLVDRYGARIDASIRAGDEIGIHPHFHRWDSRARTWLLDLTDRSWIADCALGALDAFATALGRPCRTTHLGAWIDAPVLDLLDRRGVHVDLSLRPDQYRTRRFDAGGISRGYLPSSVGVP